MKRTFKILPVVALTLVVAFCAPQKLYAQNFRWAMAASDAAYAGVLLITIPPFLYVFAGFSTGFFLGVVLFFKSKAPVAAALPKPLISLSFRQGLSSTQPGSLNQNILLTVTSADINDPAGKPGGREVVLIITSKDLPFDYARILTISDGNAPAAAPAEAHATICKAHTNGAGQVNITVGADGAGELLLTAVDIASGETAVEKINMR